MVVWQAAVASVAVELPPRPIQVSEDEVEVGNEVGTGYFPPGEKKNTTWSCWGYPPGADF